MKMNNNRKVRRGGRRSGYAAMLVAGSWLALCGVAALSFDMSNLYARKAEAQKAADAAALAGAYGESTSGNGLAMARQYARSNGYDIAAGATVNGRLEGSSLYRVTLNRPETVYFARLFFGPRARVGATAAAEFLQKADVPVQNYGKSDGPISFSVFGPNAYKYNGDPYSVKYVTSSATPTNILPGSRINNPDYKPGGYDFNVNPTGGISKFVTDNTDPQTGQANMVIELFDPGTENRGGADARQGLRVDEIRSGWFGPTTTTTRYTLSFDNGTPGDTRDDIVQTRDYGNDLANGSDMAWMKSFKVDLADSRYNKPGGRFNFNVTAINGSSENGFNLRAGPDYTGKLTDAQWAAQYGTSVGMSGKGSLPLNFNNAGQVTIDLGSVPPLPKGGQLKVRKFDVDVTPPGAKFNRVDYFENGKFKFTGSTVVGGQANGRWQTDEFKLPNGYAGGAWTATYYAGTNDTSVWEMTYPGPSNIRLVR